MYVEKSPPPPPLLLSVLNFLATPIGGKTTPWKIKQKTKYLRYQNESLQSMYVEESTPACIPMRVLAFDREVFSNPFGGKATPWG